MITLGILAIIGVLITVFGIMFSSEEIKELDTPEIKIE